MFLCTKIDDAIEFFKLAIFSLLSLAEIHKMQIDFLHWDWFMIFFCVGNFHSTIYFSFGLFFLRILQTNPRDFFHGCKFKCADITKIKLGQVEFSTFFQSLMFVVCTTLLCCFSEVFFCENSCQIRFNLYKGS